MRTPALAPLALAAALLLTLAGCTADAPTSTDDSSQADDSGTDEQPSEDAATSDLAPVLTDAPADGGPVIEISSADGMSPSELTISAGDVVSFVTGDGSFHGLVVNQLASVTVADNLPEYYQFNDPGTYYVSDELSDATAVITVE